MAENWTKNAKYYNLNPRLIYYMVTLDKSTEQFYNRGDRIHKSMKNKMLWINILGLVDKDLNQWVDIF